jgi:hypothetical protein
MTYYFNGVALTEESMQATRQYYHDNALACIEEVKSGKVYVNDPESYFEWRMRESKEYIEGKHDHVLAFLQHAYYIQTGESIALLP